MILNILLLIGYVWIFANILSYTYLWRLKEYRWDRMIIHIRITSLFLLLFPPYRRPPMTPKTIIIICLTTFGMLRFLSTQNIILLYLLCFPFTFISVCIVNFPVYIYHTYLRFLAAKKIQSHPGLLTIGITGSYGKTSVKEYLHTILSTKYNVLKTQASKNSSVGISEVVLKHLNKYHEIFIAEMGAYKIGEIKDMVDFVHPQIGIITSINAQHQDLFGSIENTIKAKSELLSGLIGRKTAVVNYDNPFVLKMGENAKEAGIQVYWYSTKKQLDNLSVYATNMRADFSGVTFTCVYNNEKAVVHSNVLGAHQVTNILAAICAALAVGMKFKDIMVAIPLLKPREHVLQVSPGFNRSLYIDDTFNNNPDAARAAIDVLSMAAGKKILVFQPMIELGSFAKSSHEIVGFAAGRVCDYVILTNPSFSADFLRGVNKKVTRTKVKFLTPTQAAREIKKMIGSGDVVLFKGKEAANYMKAL